ncbi:MAG: lipopolysaccharide heptosyltransferase [Gammaproteobacteria bacterium]|nr:lipopolysaccharide heptosyltransferase [Gammaproteobacteria bacterium]
MGDVIHTLPALTDAGKAIPAISFDWVVEENFSEIPRWHPLVKQVIPVALRRWRKAIFTKKTVQEWQAFRQLLRATQYDLIIDAQGLLKSAFLALNARGTSCGFDFYSARDPIAALFYRQRFVTAKVKEQHAVTRVRSLLSQALGYTLPETVPNYGIDRQQFQQAGETEPYLVFLHGTTWTTKHWPELYWMELAKLASDQGFAIKLPWGNISERERALRIAENCLRAEVLPKQDLGGMAKVLAGARAIVAVDTGLGHLAAALAVPTVSLYGPTNPVLTGAIGESQQHLMASFPCAPCFGRECTYKGNDYSPLNPLNPPCFVTLPPTVVWGALSSML